MNRKSECVKYFRQNQIWKQIFSGFRDKYSSYGCFTGKVTVRNLTAQDIDVLEGFFGRSFHGQKSITISADKFVKAINDSRYRGISPEEILEEYFGQELIGKGELRKKREEQIKDIKREYKQYFKNTPAENQLEEFCSIIRYRIGADDNRLKSVLWLCADTYNQLPYRQNRKMYLAVFSAMVTGNPHAFDNGTAEGKLLHELIQLDLKQRDMSVYAKGELSSAYKRQKSLLLAGIMIDDISNYTMIYNVHAYKKDGCMHRGIEGFYEEKEIAQISLNTISELDRVECVDNEIYIVENPSVFATICGDKSCMCMNGQPRLAGLMLLELLAKSGTKGYYSGDLDPEGLIIAQKLSRFYKGAFCYWHMDRVDYDRCKSQEVISDRRIKMLDKITDEALIPVARQIASEKLAGYQENITDFFDNTSSLSGIN